MRSSLKLGTLVIGLGLVVAAGAQAAQYNALVTLNSSNEVPTNGSTATGAANVCIDTDNNTVTFNLMHNVANQTAAHFHGYVGPGTNAGVVFSIGVGAQVKGTWNYNQADEANILAGLTYINVHSNIFPGGEIRGQVVPVPGSCAINPLPATSHTGLFAAAGILLGLGALVGVRRMTSRA